MPRQKRANKPKGKTVGLYGSEQDADSNMDLGSADSFFSRSQGEDSDGY